MCPRAGRYLFARLRRGTAAKHRPLMRLARAIAIAVVLVGVISLGASAQPYDGVTPAPRTTDPVRMQALANEREIVERIRLGIAADVRGDDAGAAAEFARALALKPREPQASTAAYDLGLAQARLGRLDDAVAALEDAIERDSGFLAARSNLVTVQLLRGDMHAARSAADALVAVVPDSARALYARGIIALRSGDTPTALADFRRLLERNPAYALAHYNLALAEQRAQSFGEAERELRTALELAPDYARARIALGAVLLREGKRDDARATFDEASRTSADVTLRNLALALRDAIHN